MDVWEGRQPLSERVEESPDFAGADTSETLGAFKATESVTENIPLEG